jgi:hypothetical protein
MEFIFPGSKFKLFPLEAAVENSSILTNIVNTLKIFDTGIYDSKIIDFNPSGKFPKDLIEDVQSNIAKDTSVVLFDLKGAFYIVQKDPLSNMPNWKQIVFLHQVNGEPVQVNFEMSEESDGTLRMIDLIPILFMEDSLIFVDEIDRSLHPSLIHDFFEKYFENGYVSQLIFTTHEDHLLDQNLFRRDEFWFIEKNEQGSSQLYSLEEFSPRIDLNLQKGYLFGRFGAIPVIGDIDADKVFHEQRQNR